MPEYSHSISPSPLTLTLDRARVGRLEAVAVREMVSTGSLIESAWAGTLSRYLGESDVTFTIRQDGAATARRASVSVNPSIDMVELARRSTSEAGEPTDPVLHISAAADGLVIAVQCETRRFDRWTIERMLAHFERCLEFVSNSPTAALAELPGLADEERHKVLNSWNPQRIGWRVDASIPALFAEQVGLHPDAPAVRFGDQVVTYAELDARSNQVARRLDALGVRPDQPVALCLDRSPDLIVALLGILKAGGGYLPLDPHFPADRTAFMVSDAGARVLITDVARQAQLPVHDGPVLLMDADAANLAQESATPIDVAVGGEQLAYINYTSGSTGKPKGVEVLHRAVNRLVCQVDFATLGPRATLLHAAPLTFDASTFEIWGALLNGGCCALHDERVPTASGLAASIARYGVTTAWLTTALFNTVVDDDPTSLIGLQELLVGGEALSVDHIRRAQAALPSVQLINGYGPTESTTFACCYRIPAPLGDGLTSIPIGRPIRDTQVYIVDEQGELAALGAPGELCIGGDGLARGYLNRPELTAERFVPNRFGAAGERVYRTGDLARWLDDGTVQYIGRRDGQLKIRGFRVELGEIQSVLMKHPSIRSCAVVPRTDERSGARLAAYLVAETAAVVPTIDTLREFMRLELPRQMIPSAFVWLTALPVTTNGKLDRAALPSPRGRPELAHEYTAPTTPTQQRIARVWSELLSLDEIGIDDAFFDLGGDSLNLVQLGTRLRQEHGIDVPLVRLFEHTTVRALADHVDQLQADKPNQAAVPVRSSPSQDRGRIAVVGMAGRFPGAASVERLWQNLSAGLDATTFFADAELDASIPAATRNDSSYVRARGILENVDLFDAGFFGISPREAELMDPQQRVLLEVAWEALERAGHVPDSFAGDIGIWAGKYNDSYYANNVQARPDLIDQLGAFNVMIANEKDYVATRLAHKLDLTGPALSIHTACSTSLVAVCEAVHSLRRGECDLALAGGVSIVVPVRSGYQYQEGAMLSLDGRTRSFDAQASGTTFSDGAAILVLRRLEDALADGDTVYAVIRGVAVNNDGAHKASFTAPSVKGQARVIARAQADAQVDARSISYVEAHGTATPMGDPIEVEALTRAFRADTPDRNFCAIGSLKSNLGHLVIAAGGAGLIKTALALHHEVIPPTINFETPNPSIDFQNSPFHVATESIAWPRGAEPRRAGVSSFGVGGTNAHVVIEEAPASLPSTPTSSEQLVVISARTPSALDAATTNLARHLREHPEVRLADVAFTLQAGRRAFSHRRALVGRSAQTVAEALEVRDPRRCADHHMRAGAPDVVFLFPGQGAQHVDMGRGLYDSELVFRAAVGQCADLLLPHLDGFDIRRALYPGDAPGAAETLRQTALAQVAIFTIEYALARLWISWGVAPVAMIGHSVGEFVCAVLAEVMSLDDALALVAIRGRLMQAQPGGSMLAVNLDATTMEKRISGWPELSVAAENAPLACVVAGPSEAIARLAAELETEAVGCRSLVTSHAFHSPMMNAVVEPFARRVGEVALRPPSRPFVSTVTGGWITSEQAIDPGYWARHLRAPVRFASALQTIWSRPAATLLLEVGPRSTLTTLARRQAPDPARQVMVASLGEPGEDRRRALEAAGFLWLRGINLDWAALHAGATRQRLVLPTYPFERQRYWIDPVATALEPAPTPILTLIQPPPPTVTAIAVATPAQFVTPTESDMQATSIPSASNPVRINQLLELIEEVTGLELHGVDSASTFVELGLDSLSLTQVALQVKRRFGVKITFRLLMEACPSPAALAEYLDTQLPAETAPSATPVAVAQPAAAAAPIAAQLPVGAAAAAAAPIAAQLPVGLGQDARAVTLPSAMTAWPAGQAQPLNGIQRVIDQQLKLMSQQLALLTAAGAEGGSGVAERTEARAEMAIARMQSELPLAVAATSEPAITAPTAPAASTAGTVPTSPTAPTESAAGVAMPLLPEQDPASGLVKYDAKKAFGAIARIHTTGSDQLTQKQRARFDAFVRRYTARTRESKRLTQANRRFLADPRAVTGFRPGIKELVYPITIERSAGSKVWDADGNQYVDVLNGFGSCFFGWQPSFVTEAVTAQIARGYEIGPMHPLAGEVAQLVCDLTGFERAGFCNTGSEAVLGAIRVARTVTGRSLIALFSGAYHGINDEVIVRGTRRKAVPAAPGILPATAENVLVLDYGTPEALETLRARADELAGILVEPVQSRRPEFQPREFLHALRRLADASGTALIMDEMVTGFRTAPGGAQEFFDVRGDMATYGKVIGGGFPMGVIAGKREWMDALDGGHWQYGDDSVPTVGVTYFAGTFVRHPLALAAAKAVLQHLKQAGPSLQREMNAVTAAFAAEVNTFFREVGAPLEIRHFGSFWKPFFTADHAHGDLLFLMMRDRGVHILDGFPCFFTTAHSTADIALVVAAFRDSVAEMQESGFLPEATRHTSTFDHRTPPVPGARLGRDSNGSPAWFVPNPQENGKYMKVRSN